MLWLWNVNPTSLIMTFKIKVLPNFLKVYFRSTSSLVITVFGVLAVTPSETATSTSSQENAERLLVITPSETTSSRILTRYN